MTDAQPTNLRAVRTHQGSKTFVVVTVGGQETRLGGKRAERAAAAIVVQWPDTLIAGSGVYGLRGDFAKAEAEAFRLVNQRAIQTRGGGVVRCNLADWAVAVPVEEG